MVNHPNTPRSVRTWQGRHNAKEENGKIASLPKHFKYIPWIYPPNFKPVTVEFTFSDSLLSAALKAALQQVQMYSATTPGV